MARKSGHRKPPTFRQWLILLAVILVAVLVRNYLAPGSAVENDSATGAMTAEKAAAEMISGVMIDTAGRVSRVMSDDNEGSRHQRFILELVSGHTVLVTHNIDLAKRIPLAAGDRVVIRGQYEWNDRGGVLHWTHHDPASRHEGGWIDHKGQRYQ
jgi:hypothetical protein